MARYVVQEGKIYTARNPCYINLWLPLHNSSISSGLIKCISSFFTQVHGNSLQMFKKTQHMTQQPIKMRSMESNQLHLQWLTVQPCTIELGSRAGQNNLTFINCPHYHCYYTDPGYISAHLIVMTGEWGHSYYNVGLSEEKLREWHDRV